MLLKKVQHRKSTHPWLTEDVLEKVAAKQEAEGTETEKEAAEACSEAVRTAYKQYVHRVREELKTLPKNSKKWWVKSQELIVRKSKVSHVPALKGEDGTWHRISEEKAQLLAEIFGKKYVLNAAESNEYTEMKTNDEEVPDL